MGLLDLVVGSALGPVGSIGLKVVKSPMFWKGLLVLAIVATIYFGFSSYRAMAAELAVTQSDLADTEEAWLLTQAEVEAANKESERVNKLIASVYGDKRILRKSLDDRLKYIRLLEGELEDEAFKTCLDISVPDSYLNGLFRSP